MCLCSPRERERERERERARARERERERERERDFVGALASDDVNKPPTGAYRQHTCRSGNKGQKTKY